MKETSYSIKSLYSKILTIHIKGVTYRIPPRSSLKGFSVLESQIDSTLKELVNSRLILLIPIQKANNLKTTTKEVEENE